ncbi:kinase [Streptococcus sp. ZJ151]|uniref:class III lanthionine synthetase LanKC N-terminal domain-containing protein n=1 Tax=Streptococcus jiangjianxini TaxID=3161189 RepID=UPI0032EFA28A
MKKEELIYKNIQPYKLPFWGYKIHISATISNYNKIFSIVEPILKKLDLGYKYLDGYESIWNNFSVNETMAESGKFFTIYPKDKQELLIALEELYESLKEEEGIYIMSDRPYKDSKTVFYRYGVIKFDPKQTEEGVPTLYGPNNQKFQDFQKNYFEIPEWIDDIQPKEKLKDGYLGRKYTVDKLISENNGGNVYRGQILESRLGVIFKESRPNILFFDNIEKRKLRENEYLLTNRLENYTPSCIEKVSEWLNTYYIYEEVQGTNLYSYLKEYTIFNFGTKTNFDLSENILKFSKFISTIKKVINLIYHFHENDIVLNDIHPDNFIVDFNENIFFVDMEHSYLYGDSPIIGIHHDIALPEWNSLDGKIADCNKLGNMILFMIARLQINNKTVYNKELLDTLLKNFGIYSNISDLIGYLFTSDANIVKAKDIIKQVYVKKSNQKYNLDVSNLPKNSYCIDFIPYIKSNHSYFSDSDDIKYQIDSYDRYGIDGLAGKLYTNYIVGKISNDELNYGLQKILDKLIYTKMGRMVPIENNNGSPYLDSGNAGLISVLILLDPEKYKDIIIELTDSLKFEFAQRPGYFNGMLGVAEVLLNVYSQIYKKDDYLFYAEKLLLNTSFYVEYKLVEKEQFIQVFNYYIGVINESTDK